MAEFSEPSAKKKYRIAIETFLGADRTTPPGSVSMSRSPECPNMIRSTPGIVRKRYGITTMKNYNIPGLARYTITHVAAVGDTFEVCGVTFTAVASEAGANEFNVNANPTVQATNIKTALNANATISALYTATSSSFYVYLTETTAGGGNTPTAATVTGTITVISALTSTSAVRNINGVHFLYGATTKKLVHAGTTVYLDGTTPTSLYTSAADHISVSRQINGKLWILDGTHYLTYDGTTLSSAATTGYIPTTIIARAPSGGGTVLEQINLLSPRQKVMFAGTASDVQYWLPYTALDDTEIIVEKMDASGVFQTLTLTTDYTWNYTTGDVTFTTAPGVSPITGEDNVSITFAKTFTGYADKIAKCTFCTLYGMNGARNILFVSGNPDYPNYDYHSAVDDPSYFGDLSYSVIGQDSSEIVGYSIVNDYLVTHKTNAENDNNANLRSGSLVSGEIVFASVGSYPTSGALAKYSFAVLENEPIFVTTNKKIAAVTPSDVLGERFSQERSYRLASDLENDAYLADSYACIHNNMYFLASGSTIYILDGLQFYVEKNRPYSNRQYEAYYFPNISARIMWEEDGELWFGTTLGMLKKFDHDSESDDGVAISSYWVTPELNGNSFADKKTFIYIAARIAAYVRTSVKFSARVKGIWETVMDYNDEARYLDFGDIDFAHFTLSTDTTPHTLGQKIKIKNVDKVQFKFENSILDEPFALYEAEFLYTEGNKYKK